MYKKDEKFACVLILPCSEGVRGRVNVLVHIHGKSIFLLLANGSKSVCVTTD